MLWALAIVVSEHISVVGKYETASACNNAAQHFSHKSRDNHALLNITVHAYCYPIPKELN